MTESSFFWDGLVTGDALLAPVSSEEFRNVWRTLLITDRYDMGLIEGVATYCEAFRISFPSSTQINIQAGNALLEGNFYHYDGGSYIFATPPSGVYYYTLVLRQNKPAKTVRLAMLGPSSTTYPVAIQTSDIWDIIVGRFQIYPSGLTYQNQPSKRVTVNGMTVPVLARRQGGHASAWDQQGTNNYTLTREPRMQTGVKQWTGSATSGNITVTFPTTFEDYPIVFVCPKSGAAAYSLQIGVSGISSTEFVLYWRSEDGHTETNIDFWWIALGPKLVS